MVTHTDVMTGTSYIAAGISQTSSVVEHYPLDKLILRTQLFICGGGGGGGGGGGWTSNGIAQYKASKLQPDVCVLPPGSSSYM